MTTLAHIGRQIIEDISQQRSPLPCVLALWLTIARHLQFRTAVVS
jgi:hypothetical protein